MAFYAVSLGFTWCYAVFFLDLVFVEVNVFVRVECWLGNVW